MTTLAALIVNMIEGEFRRSVWQKRPRLFPQPLKASALSDLRNQIDIDEVMARASANANDFDFFAAGAGLTSEDLKTPGNYVLLGKLLGLFADGGTIHISNLQKYNSSALAAAKHLSRYFGCPVEADLWLTRHNQFPAYLHYDAYDIFTVQLHGEKRWRIYEPISVPEARTDPALSWDTVTEPVLDIIIKPGDVLYMPRFTPHAVTTVENYSVHLGIGVHSLTWRNLVELALDAIKEKPNVLQDYVPVDGDANVVAKGLANTVCEALGAIDLETLGQMANGSRASNYYSDIRLSRQLANQPPITQGAIFRKRPELDGKHYSSDGICHLEFTGGGIVRASGIAAPLFSFVADGREAFTIDEIPGDLDLETRLALLTRLVEVGFLNVVES